MKYLVFLVLLLALLHESTSVKIRKTHNSQTPKENPGGYEGYDYYRNLDSAGMDIGQVSDYKSFQEIKQMCNSLSFCAGFNTYGYLKGGFYPKSSWAPLSGTGHGLYVKRRTAPIFIGYVFVPNMDANGVDLAQSWTFDVEIIKKWCDGRPDCQAFNTLGWPKGSLKPRSTWVPFDAPYFGTYVKATQNFDGYDFYPGLDSAGYGLDIQQVSSSNLQAIKQACDSDPQCVGWNTWGYLKKGWTPLASWNKVSTETTVGTYVKKVAPLNLVGYQFVPNQDTTGNLQMAQYFDLQRAKTACDARSDCLGFNTLGIPKKDLSTWIPYVAPNFGVYVKVKSQYEGYDFCPGLDSPGYDLKKVSTSNLQAVKQACDSDPQCVGWNTWGYLKIRWNALVSWNKLSDDPNVGTYVKKVPPVILAGYEYVPNVDAKAADLATSWTYDLQEMKQWCDSRPQCKAFNTYGWPKGDLPDRSTWYPYLAPNFGTYVKIGPGDYPNDYDFYPNIMSSGFDLGSVPPLSRKSYCDSRSDCAGFDSWGHLKGGFQPIANWERSLLYDPTKGTYVKKSKTTPAVLEGYDMYPQVDSPGSDLQDSWTFDLQEMKQWCDSRPECKGFNTYCWPKSEIKPRSSWTPYITPGFALYVKKT